MIGTEDVELAPSEGMQFVNNPAGGRTGVLLSWLLWQRLLLLLDDREDVALFLQFLWHLGDRSLAIAEQGWLAWDDVADEWE